MAIKENEKPRLNAAQFTAVTKFSNERLELLDGEIVALGAPSELHQTIAGRLFSSLDGHTIKNNGKCKVLISPFEVVLDDDNVVQPDLLVVCDRSKLDGKRANGAPDLVIEILSESSRKRDLVDKYVLYANSGVREYWIIDPSEERTIVYLFGETIRIGFYPFDKPIPVGIWDGALEITIAELLG